MATSSENPAVRTGDGWAVAHVDGIGAVPALRELVEHERELPAQPNWSSRRGGSEEAAANYTVRSGEAMSRAGRSASDSIVALAPGDFGSVRVGD